MPLDYLPKSTKDPKIWAPKSLICSSPWSRRSPRDKSSSPTFFFDVENEQIIEHTLAIVAPEHVDGILVWHDGVLGPPEAHELSAFGHFRPPGIREGSLSTEGNLAFRANLGKNVNNNFWLFRYKETFDQTNDNINILLLW